MRHDLENLESHPFADIFPLYKDNELKELAADIQDNGLLEKIILLDGLILDGRNRYMALKLAGLPLVYEDHFTAFNGTEAEAVRLVGALNLRRRHLTTGQRAMVASRLATFQHGGDRGDQAGGVTSGDAAAAMKVSQFMVRAARGIRRSATQAIVGMCERGEITIAAAELVATLPAARQAKLATPAAVNAAAAKLRESKRTFATYTERRLVVTIGDLGEELSARGIEVFAREVEPGTLVRIDTTLELLGELRAAILATNGASSAQA